jgi:fimbrial isopeptide formation D2 family protein
MFSPKSKIARAACVAGLSLSLVSGVAAPAVQAFAAPQEGFSITGAVQGEAYRVHKLFDGSFTTDAEGKLHMGDITLNTENQAKIIDALKAVDVEVEDAKPESMSDAAWANHLTEKIAGLPEAKRQSFGNKLAGMLYDVDGAVTTTTGADGTADVAGLADGYYLICADKANSGEGYVATSAILVPVQGGKVAQGGDESGGSVAVKKSVPTVTKQIKNDKEGRETVWDGDFGKVADAGIWNEGGSYEHISRVDYEITGTVPSNIADFLGAYKYSIVDEIPDGMDAEFTNAFVNSYAQLEVRGVTVEGHNADDPLILNLDQGVEMTVAEDGKTITWSVPDLKAALEDIGVADTDMKDVKLVASVTVSTNDDDWWNGAHSLANPLVNTAHAEFSHVPYVTGEETNSTKDDQAKLYTYDLRIDKVDEAAEALKGAKFTLTSPNYGHEDAYGRVDPVARDVTANDDGTFTFRGLEADVEYTLTETQVPAGHKAIDPIKFKIAATVSAEGDEVTAITATETADPSNAATFTVEDATVVATVVNLAGPEMPVTGMAGIAGGLIAGGVLIAVSGVKLAKKQADEE